MVREMSCDDWLRPKLLFICHSVPVGGKGNYKEGFRPHRHIVELREELVGSKSHGWKSQDPPRHGVDTGKATLAYTLFQ